MIVQHDVTSYCQTGVMADGTYTRRRSAASNQLPLGTKIRIVGPQPGPGGLRLFIVRDHIGWGSSLDLWTSGCTTARRFGRRTVRFVRGWRKPR